MRSRRGGVARFGGLDRGVLRLRGRIDRGLRAFRLLQRCVDRAAQVVVRGGGLGLDRAVLVGHGGGRRFEYVQFDVTSSTTARVVHGFSGSGVREHPGGALIGIVCDAMRDDRGLGASGWLIPIEAVPRVWGDRSAAQPPSREPDSPRLVHRLAEALASTPTIADPSPIRRN